MVTTPDIAIRCLLWLLLWVVAASCSSDAGSSGGDAPPVGGALSFTFTIVTDRTGDMPSRALGVWEEDAANVAERILNIDDMRILFFDQSGVLLKTVSPAYLDYFGSEMTNDGYYTLSVAFTHEYFDKFDDDAYIPFRVMILANLRGTGAEYAVYTPGATRVTDVIDSFRLDADFYPTEATGIPMYGINGFSIRKSQLMQGIDAAVSGEIDMIRSLCKIEVADRVANAALYPSGERYPQVIGVEMISWADCGYIRPRFDDYQGGLREANIYPADPVSTSVSAHKEGGCFRFYCPEARMADMRFRVTAILAPGDTPRTYETGLESFRAEIGDELVRNHIYRFDIHAFNTIAEMTVEVNDWITQTDEFELDNIVSMEPDGFMKWTFASGDFAVSTETYNGKQEEQLSMLNGTSGYATGTFHIISPRGATWKAYFIPGENGVDAFEFVDVDASGNVIEGSQRVMDEGEVGAPATVRIRGKGAADSYRHWAELVIEVRTVDGNILYVPLTPALSSRFIIYRENRL